MDELLQRLPSVAEDVAVLLGVLLIGVKATIALLWAGLLALLLHRGSAALRHLVWSLAVVALLSLPALSMLLPGWHVTVANPSVTWLSVTLPAPLPAPVEGSVRPMRIGAVPAPWQPATSPDRAVPAVAPSAPVAAPPSAPGPPVAWSERSDPEPQRASVLWSAFVALLPYVPAVLVTIWAAGVALILGRLLLGVWGVWGLARRARAPRDPAWAELLRELTTELGIRRPVRLLLSDRASMPMTWGILRPAVLLPAGAGGWCAERRRVVLLHELVHVRRLDCLTQRLAQFACALYWPHPGVWLAAWRLRAERELACDDRVVGAGIRASAYARHLVEVARAFRSPGLSAGAALAMARPSQIEGRVVAILDERRDRRGASRPSTVVLCLFTLALALPLAALRPGMAQVVEPRPTIDRGFDSDDAPGRARDVPLAASTDAGEAWESDWSAAAATVPWGGFDPAAAERVVERQFRVQPGQTLRLELRSGGAVRIVGWDADEVFVRAELGGPDWRDSRVAVQQTKRGVEVVSWMEAPSAMSRPAHRFEIQVPRRFDVEIASTGGGVEIAGVHGRFSGATRSGEVVLTRLAGRSRLVTLDGGITVSESRLDGEVEAHGGEVVMHAVTGELRGFADGVPVLPAAIPATDAPAPVGVAFTTGDPKGRQRAVRAIAENAPAAAAVPALERIAFQDTDVRVQRQAVSSLGSLADPDAVAALSRISSDHPRSAVRSAAIEALGASGCESAVSALGDLLARSDDPAVGRAAVRALVRVYRADTEADARAEVRRVLARTARAHADRRTRALAAEALADGTVIAAAPAPPRPRNVRIDLTDEVVNAALHAGLRAISESRAVDDLNTVAVDAGIAAAEAALSTGLRSIQDEQVRRDVTDWLNGTVRSVLHEAVRSTAPKRHPSASGG